MGLDLSNIFTPSLGVDLVADINSLAPSTWASIIYDVDHEQNTVTIAQPLSPISEKSKKTDFYLTTIIVNDQTHANVRVGVPCVVREIDNEYPLANGSTTKAVTLECKPPVLETNIRSAYRLPLSKKHSIQAKLRRNKLDFYTSRHFRIRDISFAGVALLVPHQINGKKNPISELELHETFMLGMTLIHQEEKTPAGTFPVKVKVARINERFAKSHLLVGLRIIGIAKENEETLSRFIHNAQIDELKRLRSKFR